MSRIQSTAILFGLILVGVLGGCAHVSPWERGYLAEPTMDAERESSAALFSAHVFDAREGAAGGHGSTGGGCGCN